MLGVNRPETCIHLDAKKFRGSAHLADNLMLVSESIVQTWATALQNVSLADVELQDAMKPKMGESRYELNIKMLTTAIFLQSGLTYLTELL